MEEVKKEVEAIVERAISIAIEKGMNLGQLSDQLESISDHFRNSAQLSMKQLKVLK